MRRLDPLFARPGQPDRALEAVPTPQAPHATRIRYGAAAASGILLALSFPHPAWWPLAWVALVPLFLSVRGLGPAAAAGVGFAFGLAFYGLLLTWLGSLGFPAYLAVVVFAAGYCVLFGVLAAAAGGGGGDVRFAVAAVLAWVVVEWLRSLGSASFPWGLVGYSQWTNLPVLQVASVGGAYLVSAVVVAANAGVSLLLLRKPVGILLLIPAAVAWGWGSERLVRLQAERRPQLNVAAVQPNLPQQRKLDPDFAPQTQEVLLSLTRRAVASGARLVVWPEHYWPALLFQGGVLEERLRRAVPQGVALLATGEIEGRRNSAVVVENGQGLGRHDKARLVPLGEWWANPGPGYRPVPAPWGPAGVLLCYEVVYAAAARDLVLGGARYLVHSSEEGWFGRSAGPVQHLGFAVVRAVELGRDVVRAASIGVSAVIDRTGRLQATLPQLTQGWVGGTLEPRSELTPYARWGDLWMWLAAATLAVMSVPVALPWLRGRFVAAFAVPAGVALLGKVLGLWVAATGVLVAAAALMVYPDLRELGLARARHLTSVVGAVGCSAAAIWLVHAGFAAQEIPLFFQLPGLTTFLSSLVAGLGEELWLRGALPAALSRYPVAAFLLSEVGTLFLYPKARGEVVAWHLLSGAVFFYVRRLTGSVWGPVLARGLGDAIVWALLGWWPSNLG